MNNDDLIAGIRKTWLYVKSVGVEGTFVCPVSLTPRDEFINVALDADSLYEEVYLCGLSGSDYNISLVDYSYFQFSMAGDDNVRYAYYPNPFIGASIEAVRELSELAEYVTEGVMEWEEYLHRVSEIRNSQHPPLVRYENSAQGYDKFTHPCSHFHFGHHDDNRWPVRRILTPQAFALIVLKYFYRGHWESCAGIDINGQQVAREDIYTGARTDCRMLPDDLFAPEEGLQFHFA